MIVTGLHAQRQRHVRLFTGFLKEPWPQPVIEETIGLALINQEFTKPRTIFDQTDRVAAPPCGFVLLRDSE